MKLIIFIVIICIAVDVYSNDSIMYTKPVIGNSEVSCETLKEELYNSLDEIDVHIKDGRTISLCHKIDDAFYLNKENVLKCSGKSIQNILSKMNNFYCN